MPLLKQAQNPFRGRCCLLTEPGLRCPFSDLGCFCHSAGASVRVHTGFAGLEGCRAAVPGTGRQQPWGCDELPLASHRPGGPRGGHAAASRRPGLGGSSRHPGGKPWKTGLWPVGHSARLCNCNCPFPPFSSLVFKKLSTYEYVTQNRCQKTPKVPAGRKELSFKISMPQVAGAPLLHHLPYPGLGQHPVSPYSWNFSQSFASVLAQFSDSVCVCVCVCVCMLCDAVQVYVCMCTWCV